MDKVELKHLMAQRMTYMVDSLNANGHFTEKEYAIASAYVFEVTENNHLISESNNVAQDHLNDIFKFKNLIQKSFQYASIDNPDLITMSMDEFNEHVASCVEYVF